ncbi:hypothetical protein DL766_008052 [Monosporascus sp. MC13-8B]|uniref:Vacuolar h+-atpase assembly protein n=1 Tax=Monosporascus cannonballus TaxID=155416 RepID=A0ABY0H239_9PEZI|nr:hypothetical protein DL762_007489 [Monosporascus cannonballus]RYO82748.1 hypothetical protein DL763_008137 [Monosporascus cannonballus]RYP20999.1 hypothetical protein DL766_008052 [Monosporascus sp. MC13-8B]
MTASIVETIQILVENANSDILEREGINPESKDDKDGLSVEDAAIGKPISHGQIIDIWNRLKTHGDNDITLERLLRGATVYIPPPPAKPEPSEEYKALMARLRREEEERSYERMIQRGPPRETFAQRFPASRMAHSFAEVNRPSKASDMGDDDAFEHGEVQKQITLIFNFLVSIVGCGIALWLAARWWSTSARLFLSLGGSIIVAIAEVAVYSAYTWRMSEGEKKENKKKEIREIVKTWVVAGGEKEDLDLAGPPRHRLIEPEDNANSNLRKRIKDSTD